jgi:hypothetical protein
MQCRNAWVLPTNMWGSPCGDPHCPCNTCHRGDVGLCKAPRRAARYAAASCRAHVSLFGPANLLEVYEATKKSGLKGGWIQ